MICRHMQIVNVDSKINIMDRQYFTAREAADALGITLPTLYAYTSRGQVQSEPVPGEARARRYSRPDIERLLERKEARRDPAKAAARGLHWGSPVLSSGITLIHAGKLYYRGRDAIRLAETATLEQVAELLWDAAPEERLFDTAGPAVAPPGTIRDGPLVRLQIALARAEAIDPASCDLRPAAVRKTGARMLRLAAAAITGRAVRTPVHLALQSAWSAGSAAAEAIRMALVLCADHELNVSAFTARCAASAGASPYDTVSAALATLKGGRHGGATRRVAALFTEARTPAHARAAITERLRRGEPVPGFGHPLYPQGDPRAALLLRLASAGPDRVAWSLSRALSRAAAGLLHELPNLDFGLVTLVRSYRMPEDAPLLLFALGRTVGWIAHAIEQYESNQLIRPRAHYNGPPPELT
jgi:citrate synthase